MVKYSLLYANLLTLARMISIILFTILLYINTEFSRLLLPFIIIVIFITDAIDGTIARKFGSVSPKSVGTVFDIMVDNFVIITTAICLLWMQMIPFWLALIVVWNRSIMTMIRMITAVTGDAFAKPRISTKIKGWVYIFGFFTLTCIYSFKPINDLIAWDVIRVTTITLLALTTIIVFFDFTMTYRHSFSYLFNLSTVND